MITPAALCREPKGPVPGGRGERVVALVAHPDDAELLCYGTLRRAVGAGATVTVVVVTHGTDERAEEVRAAWLSTGIQLAFLGLPDGALVADRHLISAVEAELTRLGCTLLITHSLNASTDHQDHRALALAAANAATRVTTCHTVLHGEPHAPRSTFTPTVLVDITEHLDDKVTALAAHRTLLSDFQDAHVAGGFAALIMPTSSVACRRGWGVRWRRHLADEGMRKALPVISWPSVRKGRAAHGGACAHGRGGRGRGRVPAGIW